MKQTDYKIFANFETSPFTLEERGIEVDDFTKSLGLVSIAFSDLENQLEKLIHRVLKIENDIGEILTSELSFKNKVFLVISLMRKNKQLIQQNANPKYIDLFIDEFSKMLLKCEELRNQLVHSLYINYGNKGAIRIKVTAKSVGHKRKEELLETSYVLDVYDFIVSSRMYVEDVIVE